LEREPLTIAQLIRDEGRRLALRIVAGSDGLKNIIREEELHRSGLALTGFTALFPEGRIQLLGNTEMLYLRQLNASDRRETLERLFSFKLPCVIATAGNRVFSLLRELADTHKIPLLATPIVTTKFAAQISSYLSLRFAPSDNIHGTMVDVYGTGLLIIGRAGIGKSEVALDLVERGHRLVADDVVTLTRRTPEILIGTGPELLHHLIEIRGVGVINVREMFGVRAVRLQKRVETVVELVEWSGSENYERLGLEEQTCEYLGVNIPLVRLPIFPGKNITVICEAIALNLHLKVYGFDAARALSRKLAGRLRNKNRIQNYLRDDDE